MNVNASERLISPTDPMLRYTGRIGSQQSYLYFERSAALTGTQVGRWFVERKRF